MLKLQAIYPTIRLLVACVILAIGLRTWLVMGLIEPVHVAGSSMVPSHRGTYVEPRCPDCDHSFDVGAEFAANVESMTCPNCSEVEVPMEGLALQRGDRLWIDRLTLKLRSPRRWETVVARNPQDGSELCIKRVLGLPGEQVDLRGGNVRINGAVLLKPRVAQRNARQLVHRESSNSQRWQPAEASHWVRNEDSWRQTANKQDKVDWLHYQHPNSAPISDDVVYNAGITRRLNNVDEFMLSMNVRVQGEGVLHLFIDDGTSNAEVKLSLADGSLEAIESRLSRFVFQMDRATLDALLNRTVPLEFTNFDQELLLVIDERVVLRRPWPNTNAAGTDKPFSIGARGLDVTLSNLTLYRDIYYSAFPVGAPPPAVRQWLLGPEEYLLLGDNPPVSVDSRLWGPVPRRLIIGKPL